MRDPATRSTERSANWRRAAKGKGQLCALVPGAIVGSSYQLERLIDKTPLASVYLALDLHLERQVALKVLAPERAADPAVCSAFQREAVAMARLRHPNVVQVHSFGLHGALPYLVMEYMSGGTVAEMISAAHARGGQVSRRRVISALEQAARGLESAHRAGIAHGDVKPSNMLIDAGDNVTVSDFGLTGAISPRGPEGASEFVAGTPRYIAPEMILGTAAPSELHLCDVYSLGVSAFEMFTGRGVFVGSTVEQILKRHLLDRPPRVTDHRPDLPGAVNRVLQRALNKRPRRRYPSCVELADAVRSAVLS